jgi:hypothetical protein
MSRAAVVLGFLGLKRGGSSVSDLVAVDWGSGVASDSVVIHVVNDIESSYLQQKMPGSDIRGWPRRRWWNR